MAQARSTLQVIKSAEVVPSICVCQDVAGGDSAESSPAPLRLPAPGHQLLLLPCGRSRHCGEPTFQMFPIHALAGTAPPPCPP